MRAATTYSFDAFSFARIDLRRSGSDWILVRLRRTADVDRALELLRRAARATRTIAP